jgi:hypothetical protein
MLALTGTPVASTTGVLDRTVGACAPEAELPPPEQAVTIASSSMAVPDVNRVEFVGFMIVFSRLDSEWLVTTR